MTSSYLTWAIVWMVMPLGEMEMTKGDPGARVWGDGYGSKLKSPFCVY